MKKDGLLYIEVPFELIHYYIFKTKGHYEHLNYFGVKSLHNLGSCLGLQPLKIEIKLGFGNSIPVVAGLFIKNIEKNNYDASMNKSFSIYHDVINFYTLFLFLLSKLKILFNRCIHNIKNSLLN